jgi:hypothetical protein
MPKKLNMSVTSRFLTEARPIAERELPSPFPAPPRNRSAIGRLAFRGPTPKLDCSVDELVQAASLDSLEDAVFFLDTNMFTKELDPALWNAMCARKVAIAPGIWKELLPWLRTPFCNTVMRNDVVAAAQRQVARGGDTQQVSKGKIEILFLGEQYISLGYDYYHDLLALRKATGPVAANVLQKRFQRVPTRDEFLAEVQRNFGERGFLLARKGNDAATSTNRVTDEHLVVMAILTAILGGSEVFIVTRDADVLEQYFKVLVLMKENYRAMLAAEQYAAHPASMNFREVPVENDGSHVPAFAGNNVLQLETTDSEFNPLPKSFHFVNVYCWLIGGDPNQLKATFVNFCAETEMSRMLKIKAATGGLNTDKFGERNCTIRTSPLAPDNHRVIVSIGRETALPGPLAKFSFDDFYNTLFCNEVHTKHSYQPPTMPSVRL